MATSATEIFPNTEMTIHTSNSRCCVEDLTANNVHDTNSHVSPNVTSGCSGLTQTFKESKEMSGSSFSFDNFDFKPAMVKSKDFPEWGTDEINSFLKLYDDHGGKPSSGLKLESETWSLNNSGSSHSYKNSVSKKVSEITVADGGLTYGQFESRNNQKALNRTDTWSSSKDFSDLSYNKPMSSNFESSSGFEFDSSKGFTIKSSQASEGLSFSLSTYKASGYDKAHSHSPGRSPLSSPVPPGKSTVGGARHQLTLSGPDVQGRSSTPAEGVLGMSYRAKQSCADSSDFTMRFRNFQSDFLKREYEDDSSRKCPAAAPASNHRSVDEILKDFGIPNNVPAATPSNQDVITSHQKTSASHVDLANKSQNNESCSSYQGLKGSFTSMNTSEQPDKDKTFSSLAYMSNSREISKPEDHSMLAKYSSSVNLSAGLHLGKSTSFNANHAVSSCLETDPNASDGIDSKKGYPEGDKPLTGGLQSSHSNAPFSLNTASSLDIVKNLGSTTDTLEYSMSVLRQRLRKVEATITAIPTTYVSPDIPAFLKNQLQSSNRAYSSLGFADMGHSKNLPRSAFTSSATYESGVSCKSNASVKAATRNGSVILSRKSQPTAETAKVKILKPEKFCPAAEPRRQSSCWRDVNPHLSLQTPNCASRVNNRVGSQQNSNSNQKKILGCKGKETLPRSSKDCPSKNNSLSFYSNGVSSGISFLNPARIEAKCNNRRKPTAQQTESSKHCPTKRHPAVDLNQSSSFGNGYIGSDFVKDLNRMWQATYLGAQNTTQPDQNHKVAKKYMPYKPSEGKVKKNCPESNYGDPFGFDWLQSSVRKSESSWSVARPSSVVGKLTSGHDSRLGVERSSRGAQSQTSLVPHRSAQTKPIAPAFGMSFSGPGAAQPKSILKPASAKSASGYSPVTNRTSSHQTPYELVRGFSPATNRTSSHQTPYELVRGFSPVIPSKTGRLTGGTTKTVGPGKKKKPAVGNSTKARRRV